MICGNICSPQPYHRGSRHGQRWKVIFWRRLLAETLHKGIWTENWNTETLRSKERGWVYLSVPRLSGQDIFKSLHCALGLMFCCLAKDLVKLLCHFIFVLILWTFCSEKAKLYKTDAQSILFIASWYNIRFPHNTALLTCKNGPCLNLLLPWWGKQASHTQTYGEATCCMQVVSGFVIRLSLGLEY